ncbi:MAG: DUF2147 domain-containing protein [Alphaproteobacteria bacterium]|nr:DUF2147 domain-containing protein [Alphaproteobacteria bacterium]
MPDDYSGDTRTKGVVKVGGSATGEIGTAGDRDWFGVTLEAARISCIAARSAYDGRCVGGAALTRPIACRSLLATVSAAFAAAVVFSGAALADPENGKTYSSELEMNNPNTLKVRGCVWFFCQTQIWKRVK